MSQLALGNKSFEIGLVNPVIQLQQDVTGLDLLAGPGMDLGDLPGNLGGDEHTLGRSHAADGIQIRLPVGRPELPQQRSRLAVAAADSIAIIC